MTFRRVKAGLLLAVVLLAGNGCAHKWCCRQSASVSAAPPPPCCAPTGAGLNAPIPGPPPNTSGFGTVSPYYNNSLK